MGNFNIDFSKSLKVKNSSFNFTKSNKFSKVSTKRSKFKSKNLKIKQNVEKNNHSGEIIKGNTNRFRINSLKKNQKAMNRNSIEDFHVLKENMIE